MRQIRPTSDRNRSIRSGALLAAVAATAAVSASTLASASPVARPARTCSVPKYPGSGYFTSLSVTNTDCATGRKLVVAYYHCRTHSGPRGRCTHTVMGFSCHEKRNSIPTEIDGRVTCKRRTATVVHTYQQNT
ncbi:MAG TPA: hypothetical protein VGY97_08835 [Solirubrobacteraceae bacterium]|jgi:hypothetical protein|nr:hypothetical protein [Solirubrobacteraceae bacterium]